MVVACLDDIHILGQKEAATKAFELIEKFGEAIGPTCNKRKCCTNKQGCCVDDTDIEFNSDLQVLGSWLITLRVVPENKEALIISERIAHLPHPQIAFVVALLHAQQQRC